MSIASRINEMTEHLRNDWNSIDKLGLDITEENSNDNLDKNIKNIAPVLNRFYNQSSDKTDLAKNGVVGRTTQNHTIPVEYTRVDYIESSGTQYIDTGVKANQDTITDVTLEINQFTEDYNVYFGSSYQFSSQAYELMSVYRPNYGIDPSIANTYNNGYVFTDIISTNTKYNIRKEKNVAYLDGNIIASQEYAEFETPVNMYIFATNSNGDANYKSSIRLYKMTISDGTNMLRDFIPCYRNSDNVVGLYDLVNDVFYTNQGTGVFTYGTVVTEPSPDYPQEINNLSGDVEYKVRGKNLYNVYDIYSRSTSFSEDSEDFTIYQQSGTVSSPNYRPDYKHLSNRLKTSHDYWAVIEIKEVSYAGNVPKVEFFSNLTAGDIGQFSTQVAYNFNQLSNGQKIKVQVRTRDSFNNCTCLARKIMTYPVGTTSAKLVYRISILDSEPNINTFEYQPYQSTSYPISLGNIELCNISDYKDRIYSQNGKFYLEKKTGKVVLDGSEEGWSYYSTGQYFFKSWNYPGGGAKVFIKFVSNRYKNYQRQMLPSDNNKMALVQQPDRNSEINIANHDFTTTRDFKTWLSTHNTEVQYVLATPTTTEITQENYPTLYSQLLAIQEFLTKYKINKEFLLNYSSPEIEY